MVSLKAKIREKFGSKNKSLRKEGFLPAILYGAEIKNFPLEVNEKEFEKVYKEAGESSLISLEIMGKGSKKLQVLIHDTARHPLTGKFLHIDFYHPSAKKEVEAEIPLVFEGEAPAEKNLEGTLIREIQTIEVKGLAQDLPKDIKINVEKLKTFDDKITVADLKIPEKITILRNKEDIVAHVMPPRKEEEEEKPAEEEKVVEEEKPAEEEAEEEKEAGEVKSK